MATHRIMVDDPGSIQIMYLAFQQIQPGWEPGKEPAFPIDVLVPYDLANVYREACIYVTGRFPEMEHDGRGSFTLKLEA